MRSLEMDASDQSGNESNSVNSRDSWRPWTPPTESMKHHVEPAGYPDLKVDNIFSLP